MLPFKINMVYKIPPGGAQVFVVMSKNMLLMVWNDNNSHVS